MTDKWHNITTCYEPGCPTRFRADHQNPKICGWHGAQDDDEFALTETLAQKFVRGIAS